MRSAASERPDKLTESRNASYRLHRTSAVNGDNMHPLKVQIATLVRKFMPQPSNPIFHVDPKIDHQVQQSHTALFGRGTGNVMTLASRLA